MLIIDNREEIKQYLLKETESPEATDKIIAFLEKQDSLSPIYDKYIEFNTFRDAIPHSFEEIENEHEVLTDIYGINNGDALGHSVGGAFGGFSFPDIVQQIAAIITVGEFSYKLYQENKDTINNFIQTNASKEVIKARIEELLNKTIMKIKIKKTN